MSQYRLEFCRVGFARIAEINLIVFFACPEVDTITAMLETVSVKNLALVDLSINESALEEIYVKLMTN